MIDIYSDVYVFRAVPGANFEISNEIFVYADPEGLWRGFINIFKHGDARTPFAHLRTKNNAPMTLGMYKRFIAAAGEMRKKVGMACYTMFDVDTPTKHRFALKTGWRHVGTTPGTDGVMRNLYRMRGPDEPVLVYCSKTGKIVLHYD